MVTQITLVFLIWLVMLGWRVLKFAVIVAILWGAIASLTTPELPVAGSAISWVKMAEPSFFGSIFLGWIAENWMPFAITILLLNSAFNRWTLKELSQTSGYTRIFIATIMNYFEIQTETPSMKKLRDRGAWELTKEGFNYLLMTRILGFADPGEYDERLEAKAVRHGRETHLADDLKITVGPNSPLANEMRASGDDSFT